MTAAPHVLAACPSMSRQAQALVPPPPASRQLAVFVRRHAWLALLASVLLMQVHAAGSSMPWEAPLEAVLESVQGPVARIVAVIIIIVTGLTLAFGDTSGGFRRLIQIVFGLSIAFAASSFFLSFFSFSGGALV